MYFRKIWLCAALVATALYAHAGKKLHVLFLGNSYTHYNSMPQIAADIAKNMGDTLDFDMYAPGGYTIDDHGNDPTSLSKIKQSGWDYLILQEQSQLPALPAYFSNEVYSICSLFSTKNPCGRVMFYMTWGRKNGDTLNCPTFPPVCTYIGMDSLLRLSYIDMAVQHEAELSPVGAAWRYVRVHNPGINLYDADESHPSLAGSYLAACTFYTALFKKSPIPVTYNSSLSTTDANNIKLAVKAVVYDSLSYWDHTVKTPFADFSFSIGTGMNQINCVNKSMDADSYLWEFGDGGTSVLQHPIHNYTNDGTYTIKLTAYNCSLDSVYKTSYQKTVTFCPFTPTITPANLILCPGSSDTLWTQPFSTYQWYDESDNPIAGATNQYFVTSIPSGFYVKATLNGCSELSVPVKVGMASNLIKWAIDASGNLIAADTACAGDTITLSLMFDKPVNDSLIDWAFNGNQIAGYHNDTLLITQSGTYEATARHELCSSLNKKQQINFTFIKCPTNISNTNPIPYSLAPNPVTDLLHISSPVFLQGKCSISIINALGQAVLEQEAKPTEQQTIDLSSYNTGVYIVCIKHEGHCVYRKVLKK